MVENIWGVKRDTRKFQSQFEAAAPAWASERMLGSNISCGDVSLGSLLCVRNSQGRPFLTHRVEDPWGAVPGRGVEDGPQVKEEHRSDPTTAHVVRRVLLRLRDLDIRADDPQANGSACSADQQQHPSADMVNQVQQPHESNDRLHNAEDTRGQEIGVRATDPNALLT